MSPENVDASAWIEGRLDPDTYFAWARVRAYITVRLDLLAQRRGGYVSQETWSPEMRLWLRGKQSGHDFFAHAAARSDQLATIRSGARTHRRAQRMLGPARNQLHALAIAEIAAHWAQHPDAERAAVVIPHREGAPRHALRGKRSSGGLI